MAQALVWDIGSDRMVDTGPSRLLGGKEVRSSVGMVSSGISDKEGVRSGERGVGHRVMPTVEIAEEELYPHSDGGLAKGPMVGRRTTIASGRGHLWHVTRG